MIIADSSVWIDYFRDERTHAVQRLVEAAEDRTLLLGDLIVAEVLQGFATEARFKQALQAFDELPCAAMVGRDVAIAAARNFRTLRAKGVTPRKTVDVLIATFCIKNGHRLLHNDRDYDAMETYLGLKTL